MAYIIVKYNVLSYRGYEPLAEIQHLPDVIVVPLVVVLLFDQLFAQCLSVVVEVQA